jgi:hypothetical protein
MKPSYEKTHQAYAVRKGMTDYFLDNSKRIISLRRLSDKTWTTTNKSVARSVINEMLNVSPKYRDLKVVTLVIGSYIEEV